ncbi:hypothetical protein LEP1GSC047_3663 [Leptospira inadai serovar Lyme str. 10]|uniref:Uncharacterized protein n=2 Tax=Leptospira inadai serovar Lyme TaxID=293084 RepID=V6HDG6_9LEPT|nr:hypothetical protein LEP1GSC047_3663 [Leptospira inadai serovar Lyme str. 10]PNV75014.1 hypothetical protein BES34_010615 [Leptospira inadai serovar Lyme]
MTIRLSKLIRYKKRLKVFARLDFALSAKDFFFPLKRFLQNFSQNFHIENLTGYFAAITAIVSAYSLLFDSDFGNITPLTLKEKDWASILLYVFKVNSSFFGNPWIGLIFYVYVFFFMGKILEEDLGVPRFNTYLWLGAVQITAGAIFSLYVPLAVDSSLFYECLFLAVAYRHPNMQIYIFFIVPVRIKWLGFLVAGIMLYTRITYVMITGSAFPLLGILIGLSNLILFYGKDIWRDLKGNVRTQMKSVKVDSLPTVHKCFVCGITEKDDPQMDFRYCVECADHEYCEKHLHNHRHVK